MLSPLRHLTYYHLSAAQALSLSRLAYDLQSLLSPLLAAALLTLIPFRWLFAGTVLEFQAPAALTNGSRLPPA